MGSFEVTAGSGADVGLGESVLLSSGWWGVKRVIRGTFLFDTGDVVT